MVLLWGKLSGNKNSSSVTVKENTEEIFTPSIYFPLSFVISLTASLIVNLSLEFHTFSKCVFPSALSLQSHQSHSRFVMNLLSAKAKKKKWHHFQKGGDQHFNLSETENRTKEMPGRTKRGKDGDGAHSFFASLGFVCYALEIWNPFVFHSPGILLAMQDLLGNNYQKGARARPSLLLWVRWDEASIDYFKA